jgi:hypothetical protein
MKEAQEPEKFGRTAFADGRGWWPSSAPPMPAFRCRARRACSARCGRSSATISTASWRCCASTDAARAAGADVIAICNSQSPLAKSATVCLAVDHAEDRTMFLSMISRVLQLLLIDILSVGISVDAHHLREPGEQGAVNGELEQRRLLISHLDS